MSKLKVGDRVKIIDDPDVFYEYRGKKGKVLEYLNRDRVEIELDGFLGKKTTSIRILKRDCFNRRRLTSKRLPE